MGLAHAPFTTLEIGYQSDSENDILEVSAECAGQVPPLFSNFAFSLARGMEWNGSTSRRIPLIYCNTARDGRRRQREILCGDVGSGKSPLLSHSHTATCAATQAARSNQMQAIQTHPTAAGQVTMDVVHECTTACVSVGETSPRTS